MATMGKRYLRIAAALCAVAYLVVIGTAAYRISARVSDLEALAESEFSNLVDRAGAAAALGFLDEPFREAVRSAVERSQTLAAAIVTGPNGPEYAVERAAGFLVPADGHPRFAERIDVSSRPLVAPLKVETARNATVSVARLRIHQDELFDILRDALILTVIPIATAVLLLIVGTSGAKHPATRSEAYSEDTHQEYDAPAGAPGGNALDEEFDIPDIAEDLQNTPDSAPTLVPEQAASSDGPAEPEEPRLAPAHEPVVESPSGLFSPRSDLGWETYLDERLASELRRAASFEQDLVLVFFDLSGPGAEESYRGFAAEVVSFFSFRDLAFERGRTGAAVILPNIDLDHGLRMADEFHSARAAAFASGEDCGCVLKTGLSARAGRLVEAERLVAEAASALERAREDERSSIIAFKPDLERYRSFIRTRA